MLPLLFVAAAVGQSPADTAKADEAIHKYLTAEAAKLSERFMDGAKTKAEWESKRPRLKQEFLDMMGLWPLPEKTDLKATVTGTIERSGVVIEKLHYQSKPGLYVTANLYRPMASPASNGGGKKYPAILYVCGHSGKGRDGNKTAFQDHGLWFANNGYVCLVVDTLQLGEIAGTHHGTYREGRWWWHSRGYTPAGVECWNGVRGIDYLLTRPDVDPEKIGVTGISGGGATTCWVAAADDRVKVAVPVSGISDLESYVSNKVINGHCDCMFFYNTYQWEWTTVLALHAPKPLLFANSDKDGIFPMDGNRRIIARLRTCYDMLGAKDHVTEHVSPGGHDYRPDLRIAVFSFLNKHLKGDTGPVKDADFPKIDGKDLRVFPEDKDLPKDAINGKVDETFVPRAEVKWPEKKEEFAVWKAGMVKRVREMSFRALPEKIEKPKSDSPPLSRPVVWYSERYANFCSVQIGNNGVLKYAKPYYIVLNADENPADVSIWFDSRYDKQFPGAYALGVYPRGGYLMQWTKKNPPNTVERSMALIGLTADSGRVRDVISFMMPLDEKTSKQNYMGRGEAGILAAYASILAPGNLEELTVFDPPTSHRDGPYFLGVNRVLDIPEALGLLAPDVKLTLTGKNAKDKAFDKTAEMYKLAGAADKFKRE